MISLKTNVFSLNAGNNLSKSASSLDQAIRRLSSGLRINGASDDAAGQAISNRLSSQQHALAQAQRNAGDGLSLVDTAEGAMSAINGRLQRIRDLTVQGLNDTWNQQDSDAIQAEINLNLKEIDRLTTATTFNGINLLDGSAGKLGFQVGAYDNEKIDLDLSSPGFSVDELGLKDLIIRGISGKVTDENTVTGIANNISLTNGTASVSYATPAGITFPQLVRSTVNNQLYIQGNDSNGQATFFPATYNASWYTATGSGTVSVGTTSTSPLYSPVASLPARTIPSVNFTDISGTPLSASPPPALTMDSGQYYIEQNNTWYPATVSFGPTGAVSAQMSSATGLLDTDFATLPTAVTSTPVADASTASFTDASGNPVAGAARLVKNGGQYLMEVDNGGGNVQYYNASVTATSNGTTTSMQVSALSATSQNAFTAVNSVDGISVVTMDRANVELRYTDADGRSTNDVLRQDADGNYFMDASGSTTGKTATLVRQNDAASTLMLKTLQGVGDVQIYFATTYSATTDASTNATTMSIAEVGNEIRLRNPDNPLATLDKAISMVDAQRTKLGAVANRLSSVQNLQSGATASIAAARSRIEDADYATEVSAMSRAQILQQAGAQVLMKANQTPQMVLALLNG